jgi:hypothetical protein
LSVVVDLDVFFADFVGDGGFVGHGLGAEADAFNGFDVLVHDRDFAVQDDFVFFFADGWAVVGSCPVGVGDGFAFDVDLFMLT